MVSEHPVANRIIVNAAEHDDFIESVTVFQSNRAEVKRRVNLDLKRGQNHIRIERLPSGVNEDSIRVDGTGTAVIFDVVYHAPAHDQSRATAATTTLRRALEALQKERNINRQQSDFLDNYGRTLNSNNLNVEDVHRFLDSFGPRQLAVAKRIQELDVQIDKAKEEFSEAQRKELEDTQGALRGTAITVTVLAETDSPVELMLTYVVSNASWTPLYDLRASIAKTPETTSTISLHYRASITQTTGENWPDVALKLSTASPQLGTNVPKLSPWRIGIPARATTPPWRASAAFSTTSPTYSPTSPCYSPCGPTPYGPSGVSALPLPMTVRRARVANAGVLNTNYSIPGRSDIPSDEGSHKVVIAVLELQADLEWTCVPREKESVFLTCKVVNSSEFTLLPGGLIFSLMTISFPKAELSTYLQMSRLRHLWALIQLYASHTQRPRLSSRIVVRNSRNTPISIGILDHVPVSTDARLKVNVITPNGLDAAVVPTSSPNEGTNEDRVKERPWKKLRNDLKARWAPLEAGGEGTIEWSCNISPSNQVEVELAWEVSVPEGQKWEDL
ncbi:hypothetical protein OPQ81_004895 [Rhizoctonia solani]|nr:hypothetical protein OPQ81_004895 [Rhizoctonia solani]